MCKIKDLTGERFGRWTVISKAANKYKGTWWNCLCDCGTEKEVVGYSLKANDSLSCGCLRLELQTKHGMNSSRLYSIWENVKQRCYNPKAARYEQYGGRGIKMCDEWENDFTQFMMDNINDYRDDLSLDRYNPDLGYNKQNCRWVVEELQPRNKKKSPRNTSGTTGVGLYYGAWRAFWSQLDGKLRCKNFSVKKYGNDEAFKLACEYRIKMIEHLNSQGAGYTEFHGK